MAGLLVERFLERRRQGRVHVHEAFERAFYLPKIERPKHMSLRNTDEYVKPTHTVQRASTLLNENMQDISHSVIVANIEKIIKNKESVVCN